MLTHEMNDTMEPFAESDHLLLTPPGKRRRLVLSLKVSNSADGVEECDPENAPAGAISLGSCKSNGIENAWDAGSTFAPTSEPGDEVASSGFSTPTACGGDSGILLDCDPEPCRPDPLNQPAEPQLPRGEKVVFECCLSARTAVRRLISERYPSDASTRRLSLRAQLLACRRIHVLLANEERTIPCSYSTGVERDESLLAAAASEEALQIHASDISGFTPSNAGQIGGELDPAVLPLDVCAETIQVLVQGLQQADALGPILCCRSDHRKAAVIRDLAVDIELVASALLLDSAMDVHVAFCVEPRTAASAATALGACVVLRRRGIDIPTEDIFRVLSCEAEGLSQLRRATQCMTEVFRVYRVALGNA